MDSLPFKGLEKGKDRQKSPKNSHFIIENNTVTERKYCIRK